MEVVRAARKEWPMGLLLILSRAPEVPWWDDAGRRGEGKGKGEEKKERGRK